MKYKTDIIKVRYSETDQMGIVHHSNYLKFFEIARIEWLEKLKMPYEKIEENDIILPVVRCEIKFIKSLFLRVFITISADPTPGRTYAFISDSSFTEFEIIVLIPNLLKE